MKKPLVIVSGSHGFPAELVLHHLRNLHLPVYVEATSGLKNHPALRRLEVFFPDLWIKENKIESIIRIGHVPTTRLWRDLETTKIPVLNLSHKNFSGLSRTKEVLPLTSLNLEMLGSFRHEGLDDLLAEDAVQKQKVALALKNHPHSEPALLSSLRALWPEGQGVFLGNSLPIREWDQVAFDGRCHLNVAATRGANGIDGQISTFLGWSEGATSPTLGVFGDLTALYDLNAPWVIEGEMKNYVAILNNSGGKIFDRMFKSPLFQNQHEHRFEHWARQWKMSYQIFDSISSTFTHSGGVIEILPTHEETRAFWTALK